MKISYVKINLNYKIEKDRLKYIYLNNYNGEP